MIRYDEEKKNWMRTGKAQLSPKLKQIFANGKRRFYFSWDTIEKFTAWRTSEFHVKFDAKNRYPTNRGFRMKFNVELTRQATNFS